MQKKGLFDRFKMEVTGVSLMKSMTTAKTFDAIKKERKRINETSYSVKMITAIWYQNIDLDWCSFFVMGIIDIFLWLFCE